MKETQIIGIILYVACGWWAVFSVVKARKPFQLDYFLMVFLVVVSLLLIMN